MLGQVLAGAEIKVRKMPIEKRQDRSKKRERERGRKRVDAVKSTMALKIMVSFEAAAPPRSLTAAFS